MRRVLFNASNLHAGGGIQVAASVINEWLSAGAVPEWLDIWVSSQVDENVRAAGCAPSTFLRYRVVDSFGMKFAFSSLSAELGRYARVFTLFGPLYSFRSVSFSIVGFAQPWILAPDNPVARRMDFISRVTLRLKFMVQRYFFRKADILVAELEHVAVALAKLEVASPGRISVVHNCLGSIYSVPDRWLPCEIPEAGGAIRIGFVGRNYPHKNTSILPAVKAVLRERHDLDVEFFVTFTSDEWEKCGELFRSSVSNVGALSVAQCPDFYRQMDGVIFPSFLECFSATPLEALAMARPLFASDRGFNRDVCGMHASYFDPESPEDAARAIAQYFQAPPETRADLGAGRLHALSFSNARDRAMKYLALLASDDCDLQGAMRVHQ